MNIAGAGGSLERYMTMLSDRQKLVASNIANAETPGYKTRDIDFRSILASVESGSQPAVVEVAGLPVRNDGNNVSLDREARMLSENALRFAVATNLVRNEFRSIRAAIDEGKSA